MKAKIEPAAEANPSAAATPSASVYANSSVEGWKITPPRACWDIVFKGLTVAAAAVALILLAAILLQLIWHSRPALMEFGLGFLTGQHWRPYAEPTPVFGALPAIFGTLVATAIAIAIATPLAIITALFLVELAHPVLSRVIGTSIELLAAIPSIIYGMWGLFVFAPFMQHYVQPALGETLGFLPLFQGQPMGTGMLTAGIILAIMILPFICAVTRDVFAMVPTVVKESAYGMGSTTWETTWKVTLRYGVRGVVGALFLGLGRAIGETMAVTFVIGNKHQISASLFEAGQSIASALANEFNEADFELYQSALIELGLILFAMTFVIQVLARLWLRNLARRSGARG